MGREGKKEVTEAEGEQERGREKRANDLCTALALCLG
jgi:hypothetical protein